jgi:TonB family protein
MKYFWIVLLCFVTGCSLTPKQNSEQPRLLKRSGYVYPILSRYNREQGRVTLEVILLPNGSVREVKLKESSGFPSLDKAAIKATQAARFTPINTQAGRVSERKVILPIEFKHPGPVPYDMTAAGAIDTISPQALARIETAQIQDDYRTGVQAACFRYAYGLGVEPDYVKAGEWCAMGLENGIPSAIVTLARLNFHGLGVPKDRRRARALYEQAIQMGYKKAYLIASIMNWQGDGGPVDRPRARVLAKEAAELGDRRAARLLKEFDQIEAPDPATRVP